jgi:hypothetical protein
MRGDELRSSTEGQVVQSLHDELIDSEFSPRISPVLECCSRACIPISAYLLANKAVSTLSVPVRSA